MFDFIHDYDLFIFDLDGCIIDSEYQHYKSYKAALDYFAITIPFEYADYVKLLHSCNSTFADIVRAYNVPYDAFHKYKEQIFESLLSELKFIAGAEELLDRLLDMSDKQICITTNSSAARIQAVKQQLPFLRKIPHWITKNDCTKPKPSPECYIKTIARFGNTIPLDKIVVFEDSYKGFKAAEYLSVPKILIQTPDYYYYAAIDCPNKYTDFYQITGVVNCNKRAAICEKIDRYQTEISDFGKSIEHIVDMVTPLVMHCTGSIYLCGIGKSRLVCNKCVSTWQSLGIHANDLITQDLFHGDFGIFKENDMIIYISNSGDTEELLTVSEYIKHNFKLFQISISNNKHNLIRQYTNMDFVLGENRIAEADKINMAPTISSVLYMMLLDLIGVSVAEHNDFTVADFKKYHPGGSLSKK